MTVEDESGKPVGHGCRGNWVNVQAGTPDPKTSKKATFRPNGEQYGLEMVAKFVWGRDAYLAGEVQPNLRPGKYTIRASISDSVHKASVFEWEVVNPGEDSDLVVGGLTPRPENLENWASRMSEIATAAAASASMADTSVSWGGTALWPEESPPRAGRLGGAPTEEAKGLYAALHPQLRKGLDILNSANLGADRSLLDRAAIKWTDEVRALAEQTHPDFALHFTIPEHRRGSSQDGQSLHLRPLVQRLSTFLHDLGALRITYAKYGVGTKTLDPRSRLNDLIEDNRVNFIVDEETMGGDPAPGQEKRLIVRWTFQGEEFSRSFTDGTHVELPDLPQN